jgi:hypothetical protein
MNRHTVLRKAFCEIPQTVGPYQLRPLSGGSYELLSEIKSALVSPDSAASGNTLKDTLSAVHEYIWIHSAPLDQVLAVIDRDSLPKQEIRKIAMTLEIGECLAFTTVFAQAAQRMSASMAEIDDDDDENTSPGKPETPPTGSPHLSSHAEPQAIPSENVISFGSPPSSEPSPSSTQPTSTPELDADGATPLLTLPTMPRTAPPLTPPENHSSD